MIPPLTSSGALPVGRYPATETEVEALFVTDPMWSASTTRPNIWADWQRITAQARRVVPVAAAWLSGSFLTDKIDPDDLDVAFLIDARLAAAVTNPVHRGFLSLLSQGQALRNTIGARLDTFTIS